MRLTLLLLLCTASASAQTTWHGLRFGESHDQIVSQLTTQNMPVESTPDGNLQANTDVELPLPGLHYPVPMVATFHLDANSNLADIDLSLDLHDMRRYWAALGPDAALFNFASEQFTLSLAGLYGTPIYTSPGCNIVSETPPPCTILWHGDNQSIALERTPADHHLSIHYLPIANSL